MSEDDPLSAGVIGVGSMGENHARVYDELPETTLAGVFDADAEQAAAVADRYDATAMPMGDLLDAVDVVSVAVPTAYHYDMAREALERGVHTLVEKPFVADLEEGRALDALAAERNLTLQVGHIERFNPVIETLRDVVDSVDIISVTAHRLGPPLEREIDDTAVMDLMIHDVDILLDLVDGELISTDAVGTADGRYAVANVAFDSGVVGTLTASRVTQEKVRALTISATDCRVKVDYIGQTVEIHRASTPEYLKEGGDVHYRHETLVERLTVDRHEPLKNELRSFVRVARTGEEPVVTAEDGVRVLEVTKRIDREANRTGTADRTARLTTPND